MAHNKKVNFYDGQNVDEQDFDTEQLYNKQVNTGQVLDFHGAGVIAEKIVYPVLFNKEATARSSGTPKFLDGIGLSLDAQPSDSTFGNQLKITLSDAILASKPTKIFVIGRIYDDSKDSKSSIAIEMLEFDRSEFQTTKNYFVSVLGIITQNFFGNETPTITSLFTNFNYEADLEPTDAGNTNIWIASENGVIVKSASSGIFTVSHTNSAYANYILPVSNLRDNRTYKTETRFRVDGVTTTNDDVLRPDRAFTNLWPIFTFDGNKAIGVTLIDDGGTQAVALFDMVDFAENNKILPDSAIITPFTWNDNAFHIYRLDVSVDNNLVTLTCDPGTSQTVVYGLYSSFSTYVGGLSFDITFGSNTYFGFSTGINEATNTCDISVDYHRETIKAQNATECSNDRTQQISGTLMIEEAEPLFVARDTVIAKQTISPNIKFRSVDEATNTEGNIVEPAFRIYDPEDPTVTVESVILDIIGGSINSTDLLEDIVTPNVQILTLSENTSLDTIIAEKFLVTADNIQKLRLLLSIEQNTTKTGDDQYDWSGDVVIGVRSLQTTTRCATDEAPVNAIDYDPEFSSIVEVSINQENLKENYGITLTDIPIPVDFDFSRTTIAIPGNITIGNYYIVTVRRNGDIRTGTIELQRGEDKYSSGRLSIFDGTSWLDDLDYDLWFEIYSDAIRINSGVAYDRGVRIGAQKTKTNVTTGLLEQDFHGPYSLIVNARDERNYIIIEEQEAGEDIEANPRTGNQVFSRLEDQPSFSVVSSTSLDTLKATLKPNALACVTDNNCRTPFTLNGTLPYVGLAKANTITFIDTDSNFLTLANEELRGCIISPDINNCDSQYRIVKTETTTHYFGDVTGDETVDVDDVLEMFTLDGESFSSETTQEKIIGQKTIEYDGNVAPQNDGNNPWTIRDLTDLGVAISTIVSGGTLTLNKTGGVGDNTSYFWTREEMLLSNSSSWEAIFRGRVSSASFIDATGANIESTMVGLIAHGTRIIPICFINDRANNTKYFGLGLNRDTLYYSTSATISLNDFVTYEIDFTDFHTYKIELNTAGTVSVYIDGVSTAAISSALTNFATSIITDNLEDIIMFGDSAEGSIVIQWDYFNYFIQSVASIDVITLFKSDINGDGTVDGSDIAEVQDYVNNGTPLSSGETFQTVKVTVEDLDDSCRTVDLVSEISGLAQIPYSATSYRLQCNCVWSDKLIEIVDTRRLLTSTVMENGATNCSDRGDNSLLVNNDMVINRGNIITPSGLPYHFDSEVIEMTLELPTFFWFRHQVNIFDNFIKNQMYFSDGTLVGSSALQDNQVRISAAIQSLNDFYEYDIEGTLDGYGDGYVDLQSDVALFNSISGWNPYPDELIIGENPDNGGESSAYFRFPVVAGEELAEVIELTFPYILRAIFKMTASRAKAGLQDVYRIDLIQSRNVPPFNEMLSPPTLLAAIDGAAKEIYFKFDTSISDGSLVSFPVTPFLGIGEEYQDFDNLQDAFDDQMDLLDTYDGGFSMTGHMHMFLAATEADGDSIEDLTGQSFSYGQFIGWKVSRQTTTAGEYIAFDPGVANITRRPKLNLLTARGSMETPNQASFDSVMSLRWWPHFEQNALYFDHSTGLLHINYFNPIRHTDPDARTKILLTIHLKKAGFRNTNVEITSSRLLDILNLSSSV